MKLCFECNAGEHENYDDDIQLVIVKNPEGGRPQRKYLCGEHRQALIDDGYDIETKDY